ncbi:hypothetical protein D3C77_606380 [compost metagenome]
MIFMPDRICGRQPGNSTSRITCQRLAPRLRAARTSTGSMLREASITYSSAGTNEPMKTMLYFCVSVMPNHKSDSGIQLIDGSGRRNEMMGSKTARATFEVPSKMPSGMATNTAARKPTITRRVEASTL